ncbi:MAG TPA: hypothetical protein PKG54_07730 [Phycisphaerae bacterium]|jgi:hypothetical protein|nr:hypothetical protein [Phycisphaerae bacterium]HOB74400.1 hypothetical protein [Phycisphaerae bacterium]HOJ54481.1 hypothetical protein [Phycisphaerae bacterium]HOL26510.1 hypothetical protein [Phycisphaerae bacterium]HPP20909.1 hypothetical protein [Phycisphaerae bacterium]
MPADPESRPKLVDATRDPAGPQVVCIQPAWSQTVWWILVVLLAIIATALVVRRDDSAFFRSALAQTPGLPRSLEGARGIYAFTGQISARSYGLFMVDVDTGTVWCYELERSGATGEPQLKLLAARSWVFDRYLEEFNTAAPIPSEVRAMVQQQRSNRDPATRPAGSGL